MSSLTELLTTIGLRHTADHLDDLIALATRKRWSPAQLLEHLAVEGALRGSLRVASAE